MHCVRVTEFVFFFQAEDGIRDIGVTGVQTCALPICALEKGDKKVVGVNTLAGSVDAHDKLDILRVSHQVEIDQKAELVERRRTRDDAAARAALARMVEVSRTEANMIPAMLDAVRAEATLGEICDALRAEWGTYTEPARFKKPPPPPPLARSRRDSAGGRPDGGRTSGSGGGMIGGMQPTRNGRPDPRAQ